MKVAYHDACHLAHAQRVREQPRELLRSIPELELVEPREWELCCGSAGIYNLVKPEPAAELGERKARNLLDTGAEAVAAANPGCALQITAHTERLGRGCRCCTRWSCWRARSARARARRPARQAAERWGWATSDWPNISGGPGA